MSILAESDIYTRLNNYSSLTTLLDTYEDKDENTLYGIFNGIVIPEYFTGDEVVNFYQTGPFSGAIDYVRVPYTINCRSLTSKGSKDIAMQVYTALNRYNIGTVSFVCDIQATIQPNDSTDSFNTPVEAAAIKRSL